MSDLSFRLQPATSQLPVSSYFDPAVFEREMATLFRSGPRYVGHQLSVPQPGDYQALAQVRIFVAGDPSCELPSEPMVLEAMKRAAFGTT